jgi:hypothetical protein
VDVVETGRKKLCGASALLPFSPPGQQLAINHITHILSYTPVLIYFSRILIHRHGTLHLTLNLPMMTTVTQPLATEI